MCTSHFESVYTRRVRAPPPPTSVFCDYAEIVAHNRGRGAARAEDAQGTPNQSHIPPRILVYADNTDAKPWNVTGEGERIPADERDILGEAARGPLGPLWRSGESPKVR